MSQSIIECLGLTKRFPYREPNAGGSTSGQWFHYLMGQLRARQDGRNPFAPIRSGLLAVDGVDLKIARGELFGLLGPNGAGKTTLVKMLATLLLPSGGTARVDGHDVVADPKRVRRSIAVVSSSGWLGFDMQLPIAWNLEYWAALYGLERRSIARRVADVLGIVGLEEKANESSAVLSSGMRQRLSVAKGLLAQAPVFLMDEPTVALDPRSANNIRSFVQEQINHHQGTTVLLTTQNMQEAEQLCDRVAILQKGRLIACGSPAELKRRMSGVVVNLTARGLSLELIRQFRETFGVEHAKSRVAADLGIGWCRFHLANGRRPYAEMRQFLGSRGLEAADLAEVEPNLEDLYLCLTGRELDDHASPS